MMRRLSRRSFLKAGVAVAIVPDVSSAKTSKLKNLSPIPRPAVL